MLATAPDQRDLERLFVALDEAARVRSHSQFYLWAQGALQSFLPHETLLCLRGEGSSAGSTVLLSRAVLDVETESCLLGKAGRLPAAMWLLWASRGRVPHSHPASDTPPELLRVLERSQGAYVLVHGFRAGSDAESALFVFVGMPARPGPREHHFVELLLPQLYLAWQRAEQAKALLPVGALRLSARQRQVLNGLGRGQTNAEIALELGLSALTVKSHVQVLLRKLGAANRVQAATLAARIGPWFRGSKRGA